MKKQWAPFLNSLLYSNARLSQFLASPPHSRMPNLSLTRSEIADLVAYIKAQHH